MINNQTWHRWAVLVGAAGGVIAFVLVWLALDIAREGRWPVLWTGAWLYGVGTGAGAAITYAAWGGRSVGSSVASAALGAAAATIGVYAYVLAGAIGGEPLGRFVVGAVLILLYYAVPLGLILLVVPAVLTAFSLAGLAALSRRFAPHRT